MKKIISVLLLLFALHVNAQFTNETIDTYPTLFDITYDDTNANELYARTANNHIVMSKNNGQTWEILYSHIHYMNSLQNLHGQHSLAFSTEEQIFIYNTQTNIVTSEIPAPPQDFNEFGLMPRAVHSYSVYDASGSVILANYYYYSDGVVQYTKTYYTSNAGVTWNMVYFNQEHDDVFITDVAIAPYDAQKIFLARGQGPTDVDGGLWVSSNAGQTWSESLAGVALGSIAFNPQHASQMLVATGVTGDQFTQAVYKSVDSGTTWTNLNISWSDNTINNAIYKVLYHPADGNKIAVVEFNELVTTNDGGATWETHSYESNATDYNLPITASFRPSTSEIIISTNYFPISTADNGATFSKIHAPFLNATGVSLNSSTSNQVLYYDALFGFVRKDPGTSISTSYNLSPYIFYYSYPHAVADPLTPGRLFYFTPSTDFSIGKLEVSNDYGETRTSVLEQYLMFSLEQIATDPSENTIVYASIDGNILKLDLSDMQNVTTTVLTLPSSGKTAAIYVSESDNTHLTVVKADGIFKSQDKGITWTIQNSEGLELENNFIESVTRSHTNEAHLLATTAQGIYRSVDGGANWSISLPDVLAKKITFSPFDDNIAITADFARNGTTTLYITGNGGESWTSLLPEELQYMSTNDIAFSFAQDHVKIYFATTDLGVQSYVVNNSVLGVDSPQYSEKNFIVYPNPASDNFTIRHGEGTGVISKVTLYSMSGAKVMESEKPVISISGLAKGLYLVKITTDSGITDIVRIIKD